MGGWFRVGVGLQCLALSWTLGCGRFGFSSDSAADVPMDGGSVDASDSCTVCFARLCDFDEHVIIENGINLDDAVGARVSDALNLTCGGGASSRSASQDDPSEVDQGTGRPLVPTSELAILGGGDGPHDVVRYLLQMDTPLVWSGGAMATITERVSGRVVIEEPITASSDLVMLQVVREPVGGTLALSAQGYTGNGTLASAIYAEKFFVSALDQETSSWVVVRWTEADAVPGPSDSDSFVLIESGE